MVLLEAVVLLCLLGLLVFGAITALTRGREQPAALQPAAARWTTAHYDVEEGTRVVVRKVLADGATVADEHVVETVSKADPDYDVAFLEAMARARERRALFEAEEG